MKAQQHSLTKTSGFMGTLQLVESLIKQCEDYPTEEQLSQHLPKKIPRRYLKHILQHLQSESKIVYGKNRTIIWVEADESQKKILREDFTPL